MSRDSREPDPLEGKQLTRSEQEWSKPKDSQLSWQLGIQLHVMYPEDIYF